MFRRVRDARDLAALHDSLGELIPKLLHIGQQPEGIANDLTHLARNSFPDVVLPVVNDLALKMQRGHESNSRGSTKVVA